MSACSVYLHAATLLVIQIFVPVAPDATQLVVAAHACLWVGVLYGVRVSCG